jgi:hypothetical protein
VTKLYLICFTCRRAWLGLVAAGCCGADPVIVSPFGDERGVWFRARVAGQRARAVSEIANFTDRDTMRGLLWAGVERHGRTVEIGWAR